ncbi:hypothetical protein Y032_0099g3215 [Ancylostoma ceylanicum]|uniref:Uncharacterized protein n=1 Tax=Ancylostoma ceylanicum TaxID=53326 RepID=A0A016TI66_9BILA|nr:hypothetical protein Y032_0099g3215 [Ancylostoma ceylanicum]
MVSINHQINHISITHEGMGVIFATTCESLQKTLLHIAKRLLSKTDPLACFKDMNKQHCRDLYSRTPS